jgi:chemotaxis protein CheZ
MVNDPWPKPAPSCERGIKRRTGKLERILVGEAMPEPRKIFRIEEKAAARFRAHDGDVGGPLRHAELMGEIAGLRAMLEAMAQPASADIAIASSMARNGETARLTSELNLIAGAIRGSEGPRADGTGADASTPMTRIAHELEEVVDNTERATQRVLASAEEIDQLANNLAAALQGRYEQGLAKDIQDLVVTIFEACNFQDLAGQRIAKVLTTLNFVEDHVTRVLEEIRNPSTIKRDGEQLLHGPRLDDDCGHVSQADIDQLFGGNN